MASELPDAGITTSARSLMWMYNAPTLDEN